MFNEEIKKAVRDTKKDIQDIKDQLGKSEEIDFPSLYFETIFNSKSIDEIEKRMELLLQYLKIEYVKETESTDDGTNVKEGFRKALKKKKVEKGFLCCD